MIQKPINIQGVQKNVLSSEHGHKQNTSKFIQNTKGVFWKIQNICYKMGTESFNIEEEMKLSLIHI